MLVLRQTCFFLPRTTRPSVGFSSNAALWALHRALRSVSRPKFIHPLQERRFDRTDLLIQFCQTAGLKDKWRGVGGVGGGSTDQNWLSSPNKKHWKETKEPRTWAGDVFGRLCRWLYKESKKKKNTHSSFLIRSCWFELWAAYYWDTCTFSRTEKIIYSECDPHRHQPA